MVDFNLILFKDTARYEFVVKTANDTSAGTDAVVTINVYGTKGELLNHTLKPARAGKDAFEKDSIERFSHDYKNIGKVKFHSIQQAKRVFNYFF